MAVANRDLVEVETLDNHPAAYDQESAHPAQGGSSMAAIMQIAPLARQNPRDEVRALKKILEAADDSWWWKIPNRGEGISVKCARSALRHYRNATVVQFVDEIMVNTSGRMEPGWRITVLAIDLENIVIETTTATCMKPKRNRDEKDLAYEQRCFQQQLAFSGRIERNAIMKIMPGEWQSQIADTILAKKRMKPLADRVTEAVNRCVAIGVDAGKLKKLLGCAPAAMSEAQWADVWGRCNAVKNENVAVKDAFPELFAAPEIPQAKTETAADISDFTKEIYRRAEVLGIDHDALNTHSMKLYKKPVAKIDSEDAADKILAAAQEGK